MRSTLRILAVSLALLIVPAASEAGAISYQLGSEEQVFVLLNQIRQQHHLPSFSLSLPLRNAARAHSADMLAKAYFDHDSPSEPFDVRISRYLRSTLVGENLAWGAGSYGSPAGLVSQWMHSTEHRAIILMPELRRIGLGIALGTFGGTRNAVMATADFAA